MFVNPGKFQAIIIDKRKQDHTNEVFKIGSKEIKVASQVKLLGVDIDNKLNLEQHINCIYKSAANQGGTHKYVRLGSFQPKKLVGRTVGRNFYNFYKFLEYPETKIQFVIFKPLSYYFEEKIGFDAKASLASRPVSRLIS